LHLEGSLTPETVVALAQRHGKDLPLQEARGRFTFHDFAGFLDAYLWASHFLRQPEDYAFLLRRQLERLRQQNVLYVEFILSAGLVLWKKQDLDQVLAALQAATEEERKKDPPVVVGWILDAVRHLGPEHVARVADYALRWKQAGVVAFNIGGDEARGPAELFRGSFERVRAAGLHVTVHAGETDGPQSIWAALRALGAERIGHGLAAFRDASLMDHLQRECIPLEVCPTSNLRTGALALHTGENDLRRHPLVDYTRRGLAVTLNTDDPGFFQTTLNQEYALAHELGLTRQELIRVAQTGFEAAFCDDAMRARLLAHFREHVAAL
ncbi:MAG: adenosine deaminase, partial [Terriglobia bacterium]